MRHQNPWLPVFFTAVNERVAAHQCIIFEFRILDGTYPPSHMDIFARDLLSAPPSPRFLFLVQRIYAHPMDRIALDSFVLSLYCPLLLLFPTITSHTFIIIAVQFPLSCSHLFNCWIIAITLGFLLYIPHIAIHKSFTPSEPFSSYHIIQNLGYYRYRNSIYHIPFFLVPRRHYLPLAIAGHSVDYQKSFLYIRSQGLSLHCTLLAHI